MSQEKVDLYKKKKANRKKTVKREKRNRILGIVLTVAIVGGACGWFGVSVYKETAPKKVTTISANYKAIDTYLNSIAQS